MIGSLFGTDGIRGLAVLEAVDEEEAVRLLDEERTVTPALTRVLGEALGATMPMLAGEGNTVVIGWDDRPCNPALAETLTLGLRLNGAHVVHIGNCATPTLHAAILHFNARMGCMITASHNPVTDSGVKVFDGHGYKSTRPYELEVSAAVRGLAKEDRDVDEDMREDESKPQESHLTWAEPFHRSWIKDRWGTFTDLFGGPDDGGSKLSNPFLLDSAKGFASGWFAALLTDVGVPTLEVSQQAAALNDRCGAGDMSPTQTWTWEEASASDHALVRQLQPAPEGTWVGAALDGDGDRCLVIEATALGFKVVDGDAMAARLLEAGSNHGGWRFAASIESDVALMGHARSLNAETVTVETGVGDRWLSMALRPADGGFLTGDLMPRCLGVEDSGHVVLPSAHPHQKGNWSLVGDGAATLCALLASMSRPSVAPFQRGWKRRVSVIDAHRERWQADNHLFDEVQNDATARLNALGFKTTRRKVDGEEHLLLLQGIHQSGTVSLGVRNSGTQAKTSLSLRLSPGVDPEPMARLLDELQQRLTVALT